MTPFSKNNSLPRDVHRPVVCCTQGFENSKLTLYRKYSIKSQPGLILARKRIIIFHRKLENSFYCFFEVFFYSKSRTGEKNQALQREGQLIDAFHSRFEWIKFRNAKSNFLNWHGLVSRQKLFSTFFVAKVHFKQPFSLRLCQISTNGLKLLNRLGN